MWEIESSKAFMAKSDNADLKKFAQMMVDNHTQSTEKLKAAAKSANLTPPAPKLDAEQQRMLDEIKAADAANVDAVYMRHQATAHQTALALHQGYAANGDNDALKKAAGEIAPVVQKHITELGKMSAST
jgi:putative membrane protein